MLFDDKNWLRHLFGKKNQDQRQAGRQRRRLGVEALEERATPAVITVTTASDQPSSSAHTGVSLRDAIQAANTDTSVNGSTAGSGADTIVFDSSLAGQTITLAGNDDTNPYAFGPTALVITAGSDVTIDGSTLTSGITISGDNARRVFAIFSGGSLTLQSVTVSGGKVQAGNGGSVILYGAGGGAGGMGGAVFNSGTLTLVASTLSGNSAIGGDGGGLLGGGGVVNAGGAGGGGVGGNGGNFLGTGGNSGGGGVGGAGAADNEGGDGGVNEFGVDAASGDAGVSGGGGSGGGSGTSLTSGGFGGGGGGTNGNAGSGGFGGGGGGAANGTAGSGGFGGGGGGANNGTAGSGGVGGGGGFASASVGGGGGGAGLGGAIFNNGGTVTITNSTLANNSATGGSAGGSGAGAGLGLGGGLFNRSGTLTITNGTFSSNTAQAGNGANANAAGGGLYVLDGTVNLSSSTLSGNTATGGNGGNGNYSNGDNGGNGQGGGLFVASGTLNLTSSTISGNTVAGGNGGNGGSGAGYDEETYEGYAGYAGGNGGKGQGAGLGVAGGTVTVTNSTISGNIAGGSVPAQGGSGGNGSYGGEGDDLGGTGGTGGTGGDGGSNQGGGIAALGGTLTLTNSTIALNQAVAGGTGGAGGNGGIGGENDSLGGTGGTGGTGGNSGTAGAAGDPPSGSTGGSGGAGGAGGAGRGGQAGGVFTNGGTVIVVNTILAKNSVTGTGASSPDVSGAFTTQGNNLVGDSTGSTGFTPNTNGDLVGGNGQAVIDPLLGSLANNGGPTLTLALQLGSPAIDAGSNAAASALTTDQRGTGFGRVTGGKVDIGAFEFTPIPTLSAVLDGSGNLLITDIAGANNSLTVSTASGNLIITDAKEQFITPTVGTLSNGGKTFTIALSSITGPSVTLDGGDGTDSITFAASGTSLGGKNLTAIAETITASGSITSGNGALSLLSAGDLTVAAGATVNSGSGALTLGADVKGDRTGDNGVGTLSINGSVHGANITLRGADVDVAPNASVGSATSTNSVTILSSLAGRPISLGGANATGTLALTDAELDRVTARRLVIGSVTSGNITISAAITAPASYSTLSLVTGGTIRDMNNATLTVANLAMQAGAGIGTAGNRLGTQVSKLAASGGTGGIYLGNTGTLSVTTLASTGVAGLSANGQDIDVQTTGGALNVNANVSNTGTGKVNLDAIDQVMAGQDLNVSAGITIRANGAIRLRAGDNLTLAATATLMTTGTVELGVDFGNADRNAGGTASVLGTLKAVSAVINGNTDADRFTVRPSATTPVTVNGLAPTVVPGDALFVDLTGVTRAVLRLTGPGNGTFTFAGRQPVAFTSIESPGVLNGVLAPVASTGQLSASRTTLDRGQTTRLTARVSLAPGNTDNLAGLLVQFRVNGVVVGTAPLVRVAGGYAASYTLADGLNAGRMTVDAVFLGRMVRNTTLIAPATLRPLAITVYGLPGSRRGRRPEGR